MDNTTSEAAVKPSAAFFATIRNGLKYRLFLLKNLPAAYFAGLTIEEVDEAHCTVSVPFKWFTQNPFRSTYFACLSMAAEMSTGALAMANVYKRRPSVSMLVVGMEASFAKKATGKTFFTCSDGARISDAVDRAISTATPQTITVRSTGHNADGDLVAEFTFTWSFRAKE
jgi:acyl-coenzyme A thioesterase PaaI-like protein